MFHGVCIPPPSGIVILSWGGLFRPLCKWDVLQWPKRWMNPWQLWFIVMSHSTLLWHFFKCVYRIIIIFFPYIFHISQIEFFYVYFFVVNKEMWLVPLWWCRWNTRPLHLHKNPHAWNDFNRIGIDGNFFGIFSVLTECRIIGSVDCSFVNCRQSTVSADIINWKEGNSPSGKTGEKWGKMGKNCINPSTGKKMAAKNCCVYLSLTVSPLFSVLSTWWPSTNAVCSILYSVFIEINSARVEWIKMAAKDLAASVAGDSGNRLRRQSIG